MPFTMYIHFEGIYGNDLQNIQQRTIIKIKYLT